MSEPCFHCGLPIPENADFPVTYREKREATCCAGCQAVANTIISSGLSDYYTHRTQEARQAEALPTDILEQIQLYDSEELQKSFVRLGSDATVREASLILEGITCAACVWLNEQHLRTLPGVVAVDINYTSHRARVKWDNSQIKLSRILQTVSDIGYRAHPYDAERQEALNQKTRKKAINRLWAAGLSMMQVMMYAVPIYLAPNGDIAPDFLWLLHWASLILTLPVMLYSAVPFYTSTWRDIKTRRLGMDTPVTIGILTTFFASLWALLNKRPDGIYFDSVSMFVFLLLGGRYLEGMARRKAGEASESLVKLIPAFAHTLPDWPSSRTTQEAPVSQLAIGNVILVKPGETIPVDGIVKEGHSATNESLLTGESRPVSKTAGHEVIAGTVNTSSPLMIEVTQIGQETRLSGIVRLLDQALAEKPRLAVMADRFASWFVTLLLLAAIATFIIWHPIDPQRALWITVAVLVVSCPCALSLATPAALTAASGHLASLGVLITRGHALETLSKVTDVVFDKTGTLTQGNMQLLDVQLLAPHLDRTAVLSLAAAMEAGSEHPIAQAIINGQQNKDTATLALQDLRNEPGNGVSAHFNGDNWKLGSLDYICVNGLAQPAVNPLWPADVTVVALGNSTQYVALFALGDKLRAEAPALINSLAEQGIKTHLLSGDSEQTVDAVASSLRIDAAKARATPEDKLAYVSRLQAGGRCVLMIGDGINDAPVLAKANVSMAMGSGTDVARASGDMVLINDNLELIMATRQLSRKAMIIIRQNLLWAVVYNLVALPVTMAGWVTPWMASLGMAASSLIVVSNALRLVKRKR